MKRFFFPALFLAAAAAVAQPIRVPPVRTVATLGSCSSGEQRLAIVTDGSTSTDCTAGGGSTAVLCMCNGSAWAPISASGGAGTVTSVALAVPAEWSVSGSPITTSGTITISEATQTANTVYAGPTSGGAAAPGFRALVDNDISDSITVSLSATATVLAANGPNCSAGSWASGVDASGTAEGCTADDDAPDSDSEVPDIITTAGGDAGAGITSTRAKIEVLSHNTDCTSLTDGSRGELCYEEDSDRVFFCEPTAGGCDTAGEWRLIAEASGHSHTLVGDVDGDLAANDLDETAVESELESVLDLADLQGSLTLAGDVDGAHASNDIDETAVESELESVLDLSDLQGQIADAQIANDAVDGGTGGEIADASITAADLGADSVAASELDAASVESELEAVVDIPDLQGQVSDAQIADGAVDGGTNGEIADGSITAADLGADSVATSELDASAVESELEGVLDLDQLQGQIGDAQIADGAVDGGTGGEIADGSVTVADLGADSVAASELDASAVESELEGVLDLQDLQGAVIDSQVPDTITATNYALKAGDTFTGTVLIDDEQELRLGEEDAGGANYIAFKAPAAIGSNRSCVLEDDDNPIPDSCVGDGTDGGGGGSPGGSDGNLQYRIDGSTFGGVSSSSVSGANVTLGGTLGGMTQLNVENLRMDGNSILSTDTNGNITLDPDGTGIVDSLGNVRVPTGNAFSLGTGTSPYMVRSAAETATLYTSTTSTEATWQTDTFQVWNGGSATAMMRDIGGVGYFSMRDTGNISWSATTVADPTLGDTNLTREAAGRIRVANDLKLNSLISAAQALTVADSGNGSKATATLTATSSYVECTCNDADGCTITLSETGITEGQLLVVNNVATNTCEFADTSGVSETDGAFVAGANDTISYIYNGGAWVETARSLALAASSIEDARIDGSAEADEVNPTLGTQTQGNYVASVADGSGIDVTGSAGEGWTATVNLDYTATQAGDPAMGAEEARFSTDGTGGGIIFEGSSADTNEGLLVWAPTTDKVLTLPDATDTLVGKATTDVFTNKTVDFEGTGNSYTTTSIIPLRPASCQNTTAALTWDYETANVPAATCVTGTNTQKAYADFDQTTDECIQTSLLLPDDWSGAVDMTYIWLTTATSGSVAWCTQIICVADAETDDPAFPAQASGNCVTDVAKGTTNQLNTVTDTGVTATGCAASEQMHIRVCRDPNETGGQTDTVAADARLADLYMKIRRTQ